jgi:hypothetical protein
VIGDLLVDESRGVHAVSVVKDVGCMRRQKLTLAIILASLAHSAASLAHATASLAIILVSLAHSARQATHRGAAPKPCPESLRIHDRTMQASTSSASYAPARASPIDGPAS